MVGDALGLHKPMEPEAFATGFIATDYRRCVRQTQATFGLGDFVEHLVVKPSFQVFSLSAKATNSVASVVLLCSWWVAAVVMGLLLHGDRLRVYGQEAYVRSVGRKEAEASGQTAR